MRHIVEKNELSKKNSFLFSRCLAFEVKEKLRKPLLSHALRLSARDLEAGRRTVARQPQRHGKTWSRISMVSSSHTHVDCFSFSFIYLR